MSTTMTTLVRESGLYSGGKFQVLLELADCASHDGGGAVERIETLAEYTRLSVRQAQYHIAALEREGAITREAMGRGRGGWAAWRLNVAMLEAAVERADLARKRQERRNQRQRVRQAASRAFGCAPLPLVEKVQSASPLAGAEKVQSNAGKGAIGSAEKVQSATESAPRTLYDPKEGLILSLDPHQTVDNSTGEGRNQRRTCTHSRCPPTGCLSTAERSELAGLVATVSARLDMRGKTGV